MAEAKAQPKFKDPNAQISIKGQVIDQHNITPELYDYLIAVAPSHADLFVQPDPSAPEESIKEVKESKEAKSK